MPTTKHPLRGAVMLVTVTAKLSSAIRRSFRAALAERGYRVKFFRDYLLGFDSILRETPILAIFDFEQLTAFYFELAKDISDDPKLHDMGILVLANVTDDKASLARELEVTHSYLSRPYDDEGLLARTISILHRRLLAGGVKGKLEEIGGAAHVLQMLAIAHNQGALIFDNGIVLYFTSGRIVHVIHSKLEGAKAVGNALLQPKGDFHFEPGVTPPAQTLNLEITKVLLALAQQKPPERSEPSPQERLEPIDTNMTGMTIIPNLTVAQAYVESMQGSVRFSIKEYWDSRSNAPCLIFEGGDLKLALRNATVQALPEGMRPLLVEA